MSTTWIPSIQTFQKSRLLQPNGRVAAVLVAFVLVLPQALEFSLGYKGIASSILIWALVATSYNLLHGYTGLLSFGHAAFVGMAMYLTAIFMRNFNEMVAFDLFIVAAVTAVAFTTLFAYGVGRLISEKGAIYFAMLTLAFAQIVWYIARVDPGGFTGGQNGLIRGILPDWLVSDRGNLLVELAGLSIDYYWLVATIVVLSMFGLFVLLRSPLGRSLAAVKQNEELARSIGIDTSRYKLVAFTVSAFFTALAGVLLLLYEGGVGTAVLYWETSGDIVIMTVLGGISHFFGPLVGALFWEAGSSYLSSLTMIQIPFTTISYDVSHLVQYWTVLFGSIFVAVVLLRPNGGIYQLVRDVVRVVRTTLRRILAYSGVVTDD